MTNGMKKVNPGSLFLFVVIVVMAVFFVTSLGYSDIKVKLMPAIMSGATVVLCLVALVNELRSGSKADMPTDEDGDAIEDEDKIKTPLSQYFKAFVWMVALIIGVYLVGFVVAFLIWISVYFGKHGYQRWKSIGIAALLTVIVYAVFTLALEIDLYQGELVNILMKQLGM
jgi:hypothetical protein